MGNRFADRLVGNDEWLTPPEIIKACGEFDLDPCAPVVRPWPTAKKHFTIEDDGLKQPWAGRCFVNPPYGRATGVWLKKLADHGNGIALTFARTETRMFYEQVWQRANAVLFILGRLRFFTVEGKLIACNAPAPSCLIAYGANNACALAKSGIAGRLVQL